MAFTNLNTLFGAALRTGEVVMPTPRREIRAVALAFWAIPR